MKGTIESFTPPPEREKSVVESNHWFTIHDLNVFFSDVILLFKIHLMLIARCNDSRKRKTMNYDSLKWIAQKNRCHFRKKRWTTIHWNESHKKTAVIFGRREKDNVTLSGSFLRNALANLKRKQSSCFKILFVHKKTKERLDSS